MFVLIYLSGIKKRVIVPEEWIFDQNEEYLKNNGVNRNRDVLVYWSNVGVDANDCPNGNYLPNFHAERANVHPPTNDIIEACYIGRTLHYFGEKNFGIRMIFLHENLLTSYKSNRII